MVSEHKLSFRHWFSIFFFIRFLERWVYRFASVFPISAFVFLSIWLNFCCDSPKFSWLCCSRNRSELGIVLCELFLADFSSFQFIVASDCWFLIFNFNSPWSNELRKSATTGMIILTFFVRLIMLDWFLLPIPYLMDRNIIHGVVRWGWHWMFAISWGL